MFKKGAMFGLDARIALAIFGALSVISGAALYSSIQQAKIISQVTSMKEIEKALEQYYLDTGSLPPVSASNPRDLSVLSLLEEPVGVSGWKGPYISYEKHKTGDYIIGPNRHSIALVFRETVSAENSCDNGEDCSIYIWNYESDLSFRNALEGYIDGTLGTGDTNYEGNYHFSSTNSFYKTSISYDSSNI